MYGNRSPPDQAGSLTFATGCYHQRRHWLLNRTAPYEIAVAGDGALEQHIEHDGALVALLDAIEDMLVPADPCLRW